MRDRWLWGLVTTHVLLRVGLWLGGVPLATLPLTGFWQTADLELLRDQLPTTIWHLHAQPPLWNLVVGVLEQFPGAARHPVLRGGLAMAGLAVVVLLWHLARRLGVRPWLAAAVALAVSLSPTLVGYELFAFYTLPVAALVLGVVAAADRIQSGATPATLALVTGLAAAVALTRSLFHLGWVVVVAAVVLGWHGRPTRHQLVMALAPVVLVAAWYGRVAALTGTFGSSTWLGMSLAKVTVPHLAPGELALLVEQGRVDPIALRPPFQAPYHYEDLVELPGPTGIELLDRVATSNGVRNLHNLGVAPVSDAYASAARQVIRARPGVAVQQVREGLCFFLRPGHANPQVTAVYDHLGGWRAAWDRVVLLQRDPDTGRRCDLLTAEGVRSASPTAALLVVLPVALLPGAVRRRWRGRQRPGDLALVVAGLTVGYVTVITTVVELGENYRFRFLVEPLGWLALAVAVERVLAAGTARRARAGTAS